jgi:hypothetical protein
MGSSLGPLVTTIRSLDLVKWVKLVGIPSQGERERIFDRASLYLALGHYASRTYALSSALGRGIPTILSDLPITRAHGDHHIHPNHREMLAPKLLIME